MSLNDQISKASKFAKNYEEIQVDEWSMKLAIGWVQSKFDSSVFSGATILRRRSDDDTFFILHHSFLDKTDQPLVTSDYPQLIVNTKDLSEDLRTNFGYTDLIVLK